MRGAMELSEAGEALCVKVGRQIPTDLRKEVEWGDKKV